MNKPGRPNSKNRLSSLREIISPGSTNKSEEKGPDLTELEPRVLYSATPLGDFAIDTSHQDIELARDIEVDAESPLAEELFADATSDSGTSTGEMSSEFLEYELLNNEFLIDVNSLYGFDSGIDEIVFLDAAVDDFETLYEALLDEAANNLRFEVVVIDSGANGVDVVTRTLEQRENLTGIHVISHGDAGQVQLGNSVLTTDNLEQFAGDIASWNGSLSLDADILFYGCNLASTPNGNFLLESIGELTGADVAASDDLTGSEDLGGDWELEFTAGEISTELAFSATMMEQYTSVFATINVTSTTDLLNGDTSSVASLLANDGGDGISLREAVIAANSSSDSDTIILGAGTYTLSLAGFGEEAGLTGDLDIASNIVLIGQAPGQTIIDANGIDRAFDIHSDTFVISDLTIQNGDAGVLEGGGIRIGFGASMVGDRLDIRANTADMGGGIYNGGDLDLFNSLVYNNSVTGQGGGIRSVGTMDLVNVTVSGNSAPVSSAGISVNGGATSLTNVTIADNDGFGLAANSTVTVQNIISASNSSDDVIGADVISLGGNIIGDGTGTGFGGSDSLGVDPGLQSLADNGGPTMTHGFNSGSIAQDFGVTAGSPDADARGYTTDGSADAGAYQFVPALIVDTTDDIVDGVVTSAAALLANRGADGRISLREAILAANADSGTQDLIQFNIAGTGVHTITLASLLPQITDAVIIDGTTETDFAGTPLIAIDASGTGFGDAIYLAIGSDGSTIRGLQILNGQDDGIQIDSNNNVIAGNFIGTDGTTDLGARFDGVRIAGNNNLIGGSSIADRNVIGGGGDDAIQIQSGSTGTVISGNYIGVGADGSTIISNIGDNGIEIASTSSATIIGGTNPSEGNVISGNRTAIVVNGESTTISGNWIGTDGTGLANIGNREDGIHVISSADQTVIDQNLVAGSGLTALAIEGASTTTTVTGNIIGTDQSLTQNWGSGHFGIVIDGGADGITIGGTSPGNGNVIAHSGLLGTGQDDGIAVVDSGITGVSILGNQFFDNAGEAIDLWASGANDGATTNDLGDSDSGPNDLQNFPVLTSVSTNESNEVSIKGSINSIANESIRIEFFSSSTGDAGGHGEAQNYLGFTNVTTDSSGNALFDVTLAASVARDSVVTATATNSGGSTSELAANFSAVNPDFGLVGHYKFDEGSGATATDSSGLGNDGSLLGSLAPTYVDGTESTGLDFSGTSDLVNVDDPLDGSLDFGSGDFSISLWMNTDDSEATAKRILGKKSIGGAGYTITLDPSNVLQFKADDGSVMATTTASGLNDGKWHHVIGLRNGNQFELYVDGTLIDSTTLAVGSVSNSESLTFGASDDATRQFGGILDEIRLYDRALSIEEIQVIAELEAPSISVNQRVPAAQIVPEDSSLTFSIANGNEITVDDGTASTDTRLQVWLGVQGFNGTLTLSQTTGLSFPGGSDGSSSMVIWGTEDDINAALEGAVFAPNADYNGPANITVETKIAADLQGFYDFENVANVGQDTSVGATQTGSTPGATNDAAVTIDGERGNVLSLDGDGDHLEISSTYGNPGSITVSAWVNLTGTGRNEVISLDDRVHLILDESGNGVKGSIQTAPGIWNDLTTDVYLSGTGWRHVSYTFDDSANVHKIYIDGVEVASEVNNDSIYWTGATTTYIGKHPSTPGNDYQGLIDDARIYTRALSADEVNLLAVENEEANGVALITVAPVNDAPALTGGEVFMLSSVGENNLDPPGNTVAEMIASLSGDRITDVDPGAVEGIAITGRDNTNGTWQFSIDDGGLWTSFGTVSSGNATVLDASAMVRFVPDPGYSGNSGSLSFRAWDMTDGSLSGQTNVDILASGIGGTGAYSLTLGVAQLEVFSALTAIDDSYNVSENTSFVFDPTTNDFDPESDPINVVSITDPGNGTIVDNGDGTFTYTPDAEYTGLDSVEYLINDPSTGYTNFWGLDGDAADAIGGNDGVLNGTTTVAGSLGDGLGFNETSDYVTLPDVSYGSEYTVSFDFKIDDNSGSLFQYIYSHGDINSTNSLNVFVNEASHGSDPNVLRTVLRDTNDSLDNFALQVDISGLIGDGQWHTYTVTAGTGGIEVYIDGVSRATDATRGTDAIDPLGNAYLGIREDQDVDRMYGGELDSFAIYDTALTADQVNGIAADANVGTINFNVLANSPVTDVHYTQFLGGNEFIVNTETNNSQDTPAVATLSDGGFVVVWESADQDGSGNGVFFQRYDSNGNALGSETQVNTSTTGEQEDPDIIGLTDGGFVIVWEAQNQDGSGLAVVGRKFDASGNPSTSEIVINTHTSGDQDEGGVAALSGGGFVVTWESASQDGSNDGVYLQRFDNSFSQLGVETLVNTTTSGDQQYAQITALENGGFVVVWEDNSSGDYNAIGQRFDSLGNKVGGEIVLNTTTANVEDDVQVVGLSGGGFAAVWESSDDGDGFGMFGQIFDDSGTMVGFEFAVNTTTADDQWDHRVEALPNGGFMVVWESNGGQDGSGAGVFAQQFDAIGNQINGEFQINTTTLNAQANPELALLNDGRLVAVWDSNGQDGNGDGVIGRIFTSTLYENATNGTVAAIASQTVDADPGATFTYSLTDDAGGAFQINGTTGEISVRDTTLIDYENSPTMSVTVQVQEDGGTTHDEVVTISLRNVNEAPVLNFLDGNPTFIEGGNRVLIDADVQIFDAELSLSDDFGGSTLTLERVGGANPDDFFQRGSSSNLGFAFPVFTLSGVQKGTYTSVGGQMVFTFDAGTTNADVNEVMQSLAYIHVGSNPPASVDIQWTFSDGNNGGQGSGGALQAVGSTTINITATNEAPIVDLNGSDGGGIDFSTTYTEDGGPVRIADLDAAITDVDSSEYTSMGINLSGFVDGAQELIHINDVTFSYGLTNTQTTTVGTTTFDVDFDGTGFTITQLGGGTIPQADLQQLLRATSYSHAHEDPTEGVRTFSIAAEDAEGTLSNPRSISSISVVATNDAPIFSNLDGNPTFTEGSVPVILDADVTIFDDELSNRDDFGQSFVHIYRTGGIDTNDRFSASGNLDPLTQGGDVRLSGVKVGWVSSIADGNVLIVFDAGATQVQVNEVLQSIAYQNASDNPPGSVNLTWDFYDGNTGDQGAGGQLSGSQDITVNITSVNSSPVIASGPGGGTHNEGSLGTYFNNSLTISDAENTDFDGGQLTVTLTANAESTDELSVRDGNFVTVVGNTISYDFGSGPIAVGSLVGGANSNPLIITFNSNSDAVSVEAVGQQVIFRANSEAPSGNQRSMEMTVTDGDGGTSNTVSRVVNVIPHNDAPVANIIVGGYGATENVVSNLHGTGMSISDVDAGDSNVQATLSIGAGVLTIVPGNSGVVVSGSGTGSVTMTGTVVQINNLLGAIGTGTISIEITEDDPPTSTTLTLAVDDLGNAGSGGSLTDSTSVPLTITPVNDLPTIDLDADNSSGALGNDFAAIFVENAGPVNVVDVDGVIDDPDHSSLQSLTAELYGASDGTAELLSASAPASISVNYDSVNHVLTLTNLGTATMAEFETALRSIQYENTSDTPNTAVRTIEFHAYDGVTDGLVATTTLNVQSVNDAPYFVTLPDADANTIESGINEASVVESVDLDNDGDFDLVTTTDTGEIRWHENDGTGNFSAGTLIDTEQNFNSVAIYDLEGDGDMDIVALNDDPANLDNGVFIYTNNFVGSGSVSFSESSFEGSVGGDYQGAFDLAVGDIDKNGLGDIVVNFYNGIGDSHLVMYEQESLGNWVESTIDSFVQTGYGVSLVDIDGDTYLDIVSAEFNGPNEVVWYQNDQAANPTFTRNVVGTSMAVFSLDTGDMDGDGDADIVVASWGSDEIAWFENDGTATPSFIKHNVFSDASSTWYDVELADINNDGSLDIVSAAKNNGEIRIFENNGTGSFTGQLLDSNAGAPEWIEVADLDGDGDREILFANNNGDSIQFHSNGGDGFVRATTNEFTTIAFPGITIGDVDAGANEVQITISAPNGSVSFSSTSGLTFTTGDGNLDPTAVFTGTVADINSALAGLQFTPNQYFNGETYFDISVNDQGNTGAGGDLQATERIYIDVLPVNNGPSMLSLNGIASYTENGPAVTLDNNVTVVDAELDALNGGQGNYSGASLALTRSGASNPFDSFEFSNGNGITFTAGQLTKNGNVIATFDTSSPGTLLITFTDGNTEIPTSADANSILQQIQYSNTSNTPTTSVQIDWTFNDGNSGEQGSGGALLATGSTSVNITPVNDTPVLITPGSLNTTEQFNLNLDGTGIIIADTDSGSSQVVLTLAVTEGTVSTGIGNSGVSVSNNGMSSIITGTVSQINNLLNGSSTGHIWYQNNSDNPSATATLTVTVNDQGNTGADPGTSGDGSSEEASSITTINITPVNDAPILQTNSPLNLSEGATAGIGPALLLVTDVDNSNAEIIYTVSPTPANGQLELTGNPGVAVASFSQADIDSGFVVYVHDGSNSTVDSFDFAVSDGSGGTIASSTFNISIASVDNEAPVEVANSGSAVNEGGTDSILVTELQFSDTEQPTTSITYTVTAIPTNGQLELTSDPGLAITSFTQDDIDNNRVVYTHDGGETTLDSFGFDVDDGAGNSATGNTFSISVSPVNDRPILDASGDLTLTAITEDDVNNNGNTVAEIIASDGGDRITDSDGAAEGIAISGLTSGNGTWQYSTNDGTTWSDIGSVFSNSALLLGQTDRVRFVPDTIDSDAASIHFYAWDQTEGAVGTKSDATSGSSAFSTTTDAASIQVTPVNDAPVLTPSGPSFTSINEDAFNNSGNTVADLTGAAITDIDSANDGIAITSSSNSLGTWQYSTDSGTNWFNITGVSDSSALLLRSTDSIRFIPDGANAETASISYRAWDQETGTFGTTADTTTNGGSSSFSTATDTATIDVTGVNDAPINILPQNQFTTTNTLVEFNSSNGNSLSIQDIDAGSNIVQVSLVASAGLMELGGSAGLTFVTGDGINDPVITVTGTIQDINAALDGLTFTPSNGFAGNATITIQTDDLGNSGVGTNLVDTDVINISVLGSNSTLEDSPLEFSVSNGNALTVSDNSPSDVQVRVVLSVNNGVLNLSGITGLTFEAGADGMSSMTITGLESDVNAALDGLIFTPNSNFNGSVNLNIATEAFGTVNILAGEYNSYTLGEGLLQPTDNIINNTANFGTSGISGPLNVVSTTSNVNSAYLAQGQILFDGFTQDSSMDPSELAAIENWVQAGGVLISTNDSATYDPVSNHFGLPVVGTAADTWNISNSFNAIVNGPFGQVGNVGDTFMASGSIGHFSSANLQPGDLVVATDSVSGEPTVVLRQEGLGYILFMADEGPFRAGMTGDGTVSTPNDILAANILAWAADNTSLPSATSTQVHDIQVVAVNDAPVLDNSIPTSLSTVSEDDINNNGDLIANIIATGNVGNPITDVDSGAIEGIAINSINVAGNGTWQYSADGGTNWSDVGSVSESNALLLQSTDRLRYVPDGVAADSAEIQWKAWDQSSGSAGTKVDVSLDGGTTAFSVNEVTSTITITDVNDAPTIDNSGSLLLNDIDEDDANPPGQTVASILGSDGGTPVNDVDPGSLTGIAVTSVDNSNGDWQYSTDNGNSWSSFGSVSLNSSVLLDVSSQIRFVPATDYNGVSSFVFAGWDQTSGSVGQAGVDASAGGGTSAFSTTVEAAVINILSTNDAAVIDLDANNSNSAGQDFTATFQTGNGPVAIADADSLITDTDNTTLTSLTITLTNHPDGSLEALSADVSAYPGWTQSYDSNTGILTINGVGGTHDDWQNVLESVVYDNNSTTPNTVQRVITVVGFDGQDFSSPATSYVNVLGETNAPTQVNNQLSTVNEGGSDAIDSAELLFADLQDTSSIAFTVVTPASNGQLELSSNPGVAINSFTQDDIDSGLLVYVHDGSETSSDSFTFQVDDGQGNATGIETFNISVAPVNDSPVLVTNFGLTANEGDNNVVIDASMLSTTDPDDLSSGLVYTLMDDVGNGTLSLNAVQLNPGDQFSQADIDAGLLTYTHDDSETTNDSFDFVVADGGEDGAISRAGTFAITIIPVDDHDISPVVDIDNNANTVDENSANDTYVGITASATDGDANDTVAFSLDDDAGGRFKINSVTGEVTVADGTRLDAESAASHTITVRATSTDGSFATGNYSIDINDQNEFSVGPITDIDNASNSIDENSAPGTSVGITAMASDNDLTNSNITYQLIDDDGGRFTIDPVTGDVTVNTTLNYETDGASRSIIVRAISDDGSFADQSFNIGVQDLVELSIDANTGSIANEGAMDSIVGSELHASDVNDPPSQITYTITSPPANGYMERATNPGVQISNFTQLELDNGSVRYVHDGSETTNDQFVFNVANSDGETISNQTFDINVNSVNDAPTAFGDTYTTNEDTPINGTSILVNDGDPDSTTLVAQAVTLPAHAEQFTLNSNGTFTYAPASNYHGTDSFTYQVIDDSGAVSNTATVVINVASVNDMPVGQTDSFETLGGETLVELNGVLANDVDIENDLLTAVIIDMPSNGVMTFNSDGSFAYTPNDGFFGTDTFTYMPMDASVSGSLTTVTIEVFAGITPPPGDGGPDEPDPNDNGTGDGDPEDPGTGTGDDNPLINLPSGISDDSNEPSALPSKNLKSLNLDDLLTNAIKEQQLPTDRLAIDIFDWLIENRPVKAAGVLEDLVQSLEGISFVFDANELWKNVDQLANEVSDDMSLAMDTVQLMAYTTLTATAGYVIWSLRGGFLIATLVSSLPTWSHIDPLPIVSDRNWIDGGDIDATDRLFT